MPKGTDVVGVLTSDLPIPEKPEKQQENSKVPGRPFPPGVSGNPKGRPKKGYSITEMMQEMLGSEPEKKRALGEAILQKALAGDVTAIKTLWNYMDGMPKQGIELSGEDGGDIPVLIRVKYE